MQCNGLESNKKFFEKKLKFYEKKKKNKFGQKIFFWKFSKVWKFSEVPKFGYFPKVM